MRTCLDRFVMKEHEAASRLKRGGGVEMTFDFEAAERELASTAPTPEDVFVREWEREVFTRALEELRELCLATDRRGQHRVFGEDDLAGGAPPSYGGVGQGGGI